MRQAVTNEAGIKTYRARDLMGIKRQGRREYMAITERQCNIHSDSAFTRDNGMNRHLSSRLGVCVERAV